VSSHFETLAHLSLPTSSKPRPDGTGGGADCAVGLSVAAVAMKAARLGLRAVAPTTNPARLATAPALPVPPASRAAATASASEIEPPPALARVAKAEAAAAGVAAVAATNIG
jgi:hypothetical protein